MANQRFLPPCNFANLPLESRNVLVAFDHDPPQADGDTVCNNHRRGRIEGGCDWLRWLGSRRKAESAAKYYTTIFHPAGGYPLLTQSLVCTLPKGQASMRLPR
jgi:hypothetical protein